MKRPELGICQWFHHGDYERLAWSIALAKELGVRHLRTGVSWADFHRPDGPDWYEHQMEALADFEILLSVWHTPPSIAENGACSGPPRRLGEYAAFVEQVIELYGHRFDHLELWNEPNNRYKWDFARCDPEWSKFAAMIGPAASRARARGKTTVLGGMIPVDPGWLAGLRARGALGDVDVIAFHGFPGMWWSDAPDAPCWERREHWRGWDDKVATLAPHVEGRPLWVTETGLATWDPAAQRPGRQLAQVARLEAAARAPVERVYWYCLVDLDPAREAIEGFHVDENEYHLGLVDAGGRRKPAWDRLRALLKEDADGR